MSAFAIAGTHSGVGKTTVTLGVLAALRKRGLRVQAYKIGPDFIDPGHHTAVTGTPSRTLDGWMLSREYNQWTFTRNLGSKDVRVVEGMMGLFDGYDGKSEAGSTAEMAKWLGLPVVLVVDASAMARSVAALVHGFCHFDPALRVAGVVFNRIGGPGHLRYLQEALASTPEVAIIGGLPAEELIAIPERHLGLVTAEEQPLASDRIERLVALTEKYLDLDKLLSTTTSPRPPAASEDAPLKGAPTEPAAQSPKVRFGVARDEAFCFYYPDNLELLERAGAELVFFSPMCDGHLPTKLRGVYLGGGYPEVHAQRLAANSSLRQELRWFIERDGVVYAECGGLMYLTEAIRTVEKKEFPMVGVLPATAQMLPRLSAFGYTEVEVRRQNPLLPIGRLRGHEFRYSQLEKRQAFATQLSTMYAVRKRETENPREEGFLYKRCLASYIHLHFGGNPQIAAALVAAARQG